MEHNITICEARDDHQTACFWEQLYAYFQRDLFPDPDDEDLAYFLGEEYREQIQQIHDREEDRCHYLLFYRDGLQVGFAMPVFYLSEDGKCFVMEFSVYPQFRGDGMGMACARQLLAWTKERGAKYWELNSGGKPERIRFWNRVGFQENGFDEWGEPLMLMPREDMIPITVEPLEDPEDWQLYKLLNGFRAETGKPFLTEEEQEQLSREIGNSMSGVYLAKSGHRAVGLLASHCCGEETILFVEPVFRGKGIAGQLKAAVFR